jgi:hypothetical protein
LSDPTRAREWGPQARGRGALWVVAGQGRRQCWRLGKLQFAQMV